MKNSLPPAKALSMARPDKVRHLDGIIRKPKQPDNYWGSKPFTCVIVEGLTLPPEWHEDFIRSVES